MPDPTSRFLTPTDLHVLTGRVRSRAQQRALDAMGIPYYVRPDGRPIVVADAMHRAPSAAAPAVEPNWAAVPRS